LPRSRFGFLTKAAAIRHQGPSGGESPNLKSHSAISLRVSLGASGGQDPGTALPRHWESSGSHEDRPPIYCGRILTMRHAKATSRVSCASPHFPLQDILPTSRPSGCPSISLRSWPLGYITSKPHSEPERDNPTNPVILRSDGQGVRGHGTSSSAIRCHCLILESVTVVERRRKGPDNCSGWH
jgi:hypothetical protein